MNPVHLFNLCNNNQFGLQQRDGEWYYKPFYDSPESFKPINTNKDFIRIKTCFDERNKIPKKEQFVCQCGVCLAYFAQKYYEMLFKLSPISKISPYTIIAPYTIKTIVPSHSPPKVSDAPSYHPPPPAAVPLQSISQQMHAPQLTHGGERLLGFGKYAGQTFSHVFTTDKKYCIWCIEKASQDKKTGNVSDSFQEFVIYVKVRIIDG